MEVDRFQMHEKTASEQQQQQQIALFCHFAGFAHRLIQ